MKYSLNKRIVFVFLFLGLSIGLFLVNLRMMRDIHGKKNSEVTAFAQKPTIEKPKAYSRGEIVRKAMLDPNRRFSESVIFANDEEIARYKNDGDTILEMTGIIPDGFVKFTDFSRNSYGTEYYRNGKKHGVFTEYYATGQLRREAVYEYGKLMNNKEYFFDGKLRMEENLRDRMAYSESKDNGSGKMYFRDGTLMYEWHITNADKNRYTKAYNVAGELTQVEYFDDLGKLVERVDYRKQRIAQE